MPIWPLFLCSPWMKKGDCLFDPNPVSPRVDPNREAIQEAITNGCDWRTINLEDGRVLRLFTYALPLNTAPQVLQVGRFMENSRSVLRTLMIGILALAGFSTLVLGLVAWHLAGRSLKPAQHAFDQQQAFIANASHELRAPLTIIRATAEVTMRHTETERQKALLTSLVEETDHMASLVEDLLLLSRLDAGKLKIEKEQLTSSGIVRLHHPIHLRHHGERRNYLRTNRPTVDLLWRPGTLAAGAADRIGECYPSYTGWREYFSFGKYGAERDPVRC